MTGNLYRIEHTGSAAPTVLAANITSTDSTIPATSGTGYPTGAVGNFFIVIDPGQVNEEKVRCASRTGNSFVSNGGALGRGADSTVAASHQAGAVIQHVYIAAEADDASAHLYDTARDDHSAAGVANSYMRTDGTRHDLANRHIFGAAFPNPANPSTSAIGDVANTGSAVGPPRADHTHARENFATGQSTAAAPNTAAADGTSASPAHADHVHSRTNDEVFNSVGAVHLNATDVNVSAVNTGTVSAVSVSTSAGIVAGTTVIATTTISGTNLTSAGVTTHPYKVILTNSTTQTFTTGSQADVNFDTEVTDPNNNFAANVYTVPVTGLYLVEAALLWSTTPSTGLSYLDLFRNGSELLRGTQVPFNAGIGIGLQLSAIVKLTAADTIKIQCLQNSSGSAVSMGGIFTRLAIHLLSI